MITLILARHGETNWNSVSKIQGSSNSSILTKKGKSQAELLADKIQKMGVDVIYCSELKRAKQTAAIIAKKLKLPIFYSSDLNERSFGVFEGGNVEEVFAHLRSIPIDVRYLYQPEDGESLAQFEKRVFLEAEEIIRINKEKTVLIVTHGGVIRAFIHLFKQTPFEQRADLNIPNTSLTIFKMEEDKIIEEIIADIGHLSEELL
ncbi:MAG TPA: histidine phosphatase family protein [Candidatus Saccharimonadales bacterium]|nr:histidine phosphatase family protein [Candidatus Saccharimonadales bacterium]